MVVEPMVMLMLLVLLLLLLLVFYCEMRFFVLVLQYVREEITLPA